MEIKYSLICKTSYKAMIMKMVMYWYKYRQIGQWNSIDVLEMDTTHIDNWFSTVSQVIELITFQTNDVGINGYLYVKT